MPPRERTSSQYSSHSRSSSIADSNHVPALPDVPLPLRSTSLKATAQGGGGGTNAPAVPTPGRYDLEDDEGLA